MNRWFFKPRRPRRAVVMVASVAAAGVAILVPLILLEPSNYVVTKAAGWGIASLMAAHGIAAVLAARNINRFNVALQLAVPLWSGALLFVWAIGLLDSAACGAAATVILIFATSEFGRAAGVTTLGLLAGVGATAMYALGGWAEVAFVVALVAVLGLALALTVQLVADHDRVTAQLQALAGVDALTGLVTRRVMDEALSTALSASANRGGTGLLLIDLDEFKAVNDLYGHPGGDAALQHIARVLTTAVRSSDSVVCRLGGDEMAVLLPGCPLPVLTSRAEEVVRAVREAPVTLPDGSVLQLTVSVGAAHASTHGEDVRTLYAAADKALYASKTAGRDRAALAAARPA